MTTVSTTNSAVSLQATLQASTARAADGDYKTKGAGHTVKDSDGDYKPNAPAPSSGPAATTSSTTLAALTMLKAG